MVARSYVAAGFVGGALVAFGLPATAGAAPVTESYGYTGAVQEYVVPAGVCAIELDLFGAEGGDFGGAIVAGRGGRAAARVAVSPGEVLAVYVGGRPLGLSGGFNGGGAAGVSTNNSSMGAGGGGASDVRQAGTALSNRIVVAGGGGGRSNGAGNGGDGGGLEGVAGEGPAGGGGATQAAGGVAVGNGEAGSLGAGGAGGTGFNIAGGGGGGGYYGGAGGSGAPEQLPNDYGAGGGGSGFGSAGTTFETGIREGDGLVEITSDLATGACPEAPTTVPPTTADAGAVAVTASPRFTG